MSDLDVNKIICGDNIEIMKTWPADCIDTIITDPPYGLGFMGKDWDTFAAKNIAIKTAKHKPIDHNLQTERSGSMHAGKYDHSRNAEFQLWFTQWAAEVLRIAKPGAIMMVFGGARTYHRLTCAIEDAGWQIRDCLMWLYGSGFPKSLNISKAIDKAKGEKRGRIKIPEAATNSPDYHKFSSEIDDEIPITNLAKLWDGWGTALKPAYEPIVVAMKPLDGTFAANAEKHGVAGLNIDGGRIGVEKRFNRGAANKVGGNSLDMSKEGMPEFKGQECQGRWPANVILDEESARLVDEQSGELKSGSAIGGLHRRSPKQHNCYGTFEGKRNEGDVCFGYSGGASRFFYCAKASKAERNAGCETMESQKTNDGRQIDADNAYQRGKTLRHNHHPTVKPLILMEYLCKLTKTPTGGIVLDPFGGSGTTAIACINTERDYILIEKESEYIEIAERRTEYAAKKHKERKGLFA